MHAAWWPQMASHRCHCHHCPVGTAPSGSLTGTEPIPLLCPAPAKHVPKLWDTKQRHPASSPPPKPALALLSLSCWLVLGDL